MWSGLPVVVFKKSTISEFVEHEVSGFQANSTDEFRKFLETLAKEKDLRIRMGNNAKNKAEQSFNPYKNSKCLHQIYEKVSNQKKLPLNISFDKPSEYFAASLSGKNLKEIQRHKQPILNNLKELTENETLKKFFLSCEGGLIQFYNAYPNDKWLNRMIKTFALMS